MPTGPLQSTLITAASNAYRNEQTSFIAERVFPVIPVMRETDRIMNFGKESFALEQTARANGSPANNSTYTHSYTTYSLQRHALKDVVTDTDRDNAVGPQAPDMDAAANLTDKILIRQEVAVATVAFTTTTWSLNKTLVSTDSWRYNTTTSGDPLVHANSAAVATLRWSGRAPNRCVVGYATYVLLKENTFIVDRIKWSQTGKVTYGIIASLFDVDELLVGKAQYDTNGEGLAQSNTAVWDNHALFEYVPASPSLRTPSAGYLMQKKGGLFGKKWRDDEVEGDWIEVNSWFAPVAVGTLAAYIITQTQL